VRAGGRVDSGCGSSGGGGAYRCCCCRRYSSAAVDRGERRELGWCGSGYGLWLIAADIERERCGRELSDERGRTLIGWCASVGE
jgi:hypothetical protein